jgi:SagB-type dehydrogenase family enzyme
MAFDPIDKHFLAKSREAAWELYHENSKMSLRERNTFFALPPSDALIVRTMNKLMRVKPYRDRPKVSLPEDLPMAQRTFDEVMTGRETAREFGDGSLYLEELAKILFMAYGVTRDNVNTHFPRPFRTVPSGGALYPLEIYLHATRVEGLSPGLYHYDPEDSNLDVLRTGDDSAALAKFLFQSDLARSAAAILFISAVFLRSTFKYGDRGYRFILLEAGHLSQNAILTATELGLVAAPVGGYLDREVDGYLDLDGLDESTVYMMLIGRPPAQSADGRPVPVDSY